jgi:8-oxo-dGTP diphosphatase/2-hydroxy-dATP diphosphatase
MAKTRMTVCLAYEHPYILLGMKKRGFGAGRWNGYGGKVKEGEEIEEAAIRETKEESKMEINKLEKIGIINFKFQDSPKNILEVHFFQILSYKGVPKETEEMRPRWFHEEYLPYNKMWPDDRYWVPIFLRGKKFKGKIYFKDQDTILKEKIRIVKKLK